MYRKFQMNVLTTMLICFTGFDDDDLSHMHTLPPPPDFECSNDLIPEPSLPTDDPEFNLGFSLYTSRDTVLGRKMIISLSYDILV